jgi:hypothetical protein
MSQLNPMKIAVMRQAEHIADNGTRAELGPEEKLPERTDDLMRRMRQILPVMSYSRPLILAGHSFSRCIRYSVSVTTTMPGTGSSTVSTIKVWVGAAGFGAARRFATVRFACFGAGRFLFLALAFAAARVTAALRVDLPRFPGIFFAFFGDARRVDFAFLRVAMTPASLTDVFASGQHTLTAVY